MGFKEETKEMNKKFDKHEFYAQRNRAQLNASKKLAVIDKVVWEDITISFTTYEDGGVSWDMEYKGVGFSDPSVVGESSITMCERVLESIGVLWYM